MSSNSIALRSSLYKEFLYIGSFFLYLIGERIDGEKIKEATIKEDDNKLNEKQDDEKPTSNDNKDSEVVDSNNSSDKEDGEGKEDKDKDKEKEKEEEEGTKKTPLSKGKVVTEVVETANDLVVVGDSASGKDSICIIIITITNR